MRFSEIKNTFYSKLSTLYPKEEIESLFFITIEHILSISRIQFHQNPDKNTSPNDEKKIDAILTRLSTNEPIQYILGTAPFYDLDITVNPDVLIPRQETESLVDIIIKDVVKERRKSIIDLCTGSGCIAIALAKNIPNEKIEALDISIKAIQTAKENAIKNKVKINFIHDDLLNPSKVYMSYDVIVCNPPYVRKTEMAKMHANVLDFEPHTALFVWDENPLIFYNAVINFAKLYLNQNGIIYLEINEYLGKEMCELYDVAGFKNIQILKDLNGKERFLKCNNP